MIWHDMTFYKKKNSPIVQYWIKFCNPHLPWVEVSAHGVPSAGELKHGLDWDLMDVEATGHSPQAMQLYEAGGLM